MEESVVRPQQFTLPKKTKAQRDALQAEKGTIIYNTDTNSICYCVSSAAGSTAWRYFISSTVRVY